MHRKMHCSEAIAKLAAHSVWRRGRNHRLPAGTRIRLTTDTLSSARKRSEVGHETRWHPPAIRVLKGHASEPPRRQTT